MKTRVFPITFSQLLSLLFAFAASTSVYAQAEKRPTIEDMHRLLENTARQVNTQMSNTRIDDYTTLKFVSYDKGVPIFTYYYSSSALQVIGKPKLDEAARKAMYESNREKTCSSFFSPFMRVFGLKVSHRFENIATGRLMIDVILSGKDCQPR